MILVADASVLVAELIRVRGCEFFRDPRIQVSVAEEQWSETRHELNRRMRLFVDSGRVPEDQIPQLRHEIQDVMDGNAIEVVAHRMYEGLEVIARRRIPRDPNDWPTVALAIALNAGILTNDYDFLGCGCPTWTVETLRAELAAS
jgi:predicted nucleic acid-binding protein